MMEIECPVCGNKIDYDQSSLCPECGFEVRLRLRPLPEDLQQAEDARIESVRNRYETAKKQASDYQAVKEERDDLQGRIAELTRVLANLEAQMVQAKEKKAQVPFFLMQVDANRTYQLIPIEVGRNSFGSYVAAQEANCPHHHCISPEMDATQFIIACEQTGEERYRLTLFNNGTKPIFVNGRPLSHSCPVMSPDSIEMSGYQFILLRP